MLMNTFIARFPSFPLLLLESLYVLNPYGMFALDMSARLKFSTECLEIRMLNGMMGCPQTRASLPLALNSEGKVYVAVGNAQALETCRTTHGQGLGRENAAIRDNWTGDHSTGQ